MKIIVLLTIWMAPAIFVLVKNCLERFTLLTRLAHDKVLYAFCDVRDKIAIAAIEGKISEDSEIFNFFYTTNARVIHNHAKMGVCFAALIKEIDSSYPTSDSKKGSVELKRLHREIQHADTEIKSIITVWLGAISTALYLHSPRFRLEIKRKMAAESAEKIEREMEKIAHSRQRTPNVRHVAEFGALMAKAAI